MREVQNPLVLVNLLLNNSRDQTSKVVLKDRLIFEVFSLMDAWVIKETILDRQYEQAGVPLQDGWTVVDIGAALGDYAVWAARQIPYGRLIAAEPFPKSVEVMRRNLRANQVNNVEIFEGAVSASNGVTSLKVVGKIVQNSTASAANEGTPLTVETLSLEGLLNKFLIHSCDYLKMDCEGGEYDILFSASSETLSKVHRICMEVHDGMTQYDRSHMIKFLEDNGFETRLTLNPVHDELAYLYAEKTN